YILDVPLLCPDLKDGTANKAFDGPLVIAVSVIEIDAVSTRKAVNLHLGSPLRPSPLGRQDSCPIHTVPCARRLRHERSRCSFQRSASHTRRHSLCAKCSSSCCLRCISGRHICHPVLAWQDRKLLICRAVRM